MALVAENELGDTYTLAELAELSTSNPINRRHELMTRIRGFEEFAQQFGASIGLGIGNALKLIVGETPVQLR